MPTSIFLWLLFGLLGAWFWLDSLRAREIATALGQHLCTELGVQFLDGTVALDRMGITRKRSGWLCFRRVYRFEFSDLGDNRRPGRIFMLSSRVEQIDMDGTLIIDAGRGAGS
jgi:hypothetical protein